jgi:hypothetical protein
MPVVAYESRRFQQGTLNLILMADQICREYEAQGYELTLRQLYYQFVARGLIPNTMRDYKRLGGAVNDGRLAGMIDWDHIVDRTRNMVRASTWSNPADIIRSAAYSYTENWWTDQEEYVEVWVEKEALAGVVQRPAERYQVPWFCCRGYVSQSEMWSAAQRLIRKDKAHRCTIIHDPSGIDMSRDIRDRLWTFGAQVEVHRIALNMDQVEQYSPPPNPAKLTDSRATDYVEIHGYESWELDALDPATLDALISDEIESHLDLAAFEDAKAHQEAQRAILSQVEDRWAEVAAFLNGGPDDDE